LTFITFILDLEINFVFKILTSKNKQMKKLLNIFLIITLLTGCSSSSPDINLKKIDKLISELVTDNKTVGITYAININDSIITSKSYGFTNLETKTEITKNDEFRIASITKPFTATAIMQLVEKDKLSLNDTLSQFFPNLPNSNKITIYQLLSHTSGIPDWWEGEMPKDEPKNFPMCKNPHFYIERMKKISLFEPGTFHYYSNTGYVLFGEIIEIVSGLSYSDYISQNILIPSGMKNTEMEDVEKSSKNWVAGYAYNTEFKNPFTKPQYYHMPFSAGGLRSTATDLMSFMKSLNSGKLVTKKSLEMMTTYALLNNGQSVYEKLFSPNGNKPDFPSNIEKFGYGLGFQIIQNYDTKVISHGGDIAGFNSVLMYIPKSKTTLVLLSNTENGILSNLQEIEKLVISIEINKTKAKK
jgi:D-alanyl-D-alanine carboxypeptidase